MWTLGTTLHRGEGTGFVERVIVDVAFGLTETLTLLVLTVIVCVPVRVVVVIVVPLGGLWRKFAKVKATTRKTISANEYNLFRLRLVSAIG